VGKEGTPPLFLSSISSRLKSNSSRTKLHAESLSTKTR